MSNATAAAGGSWLVPFRLAFAAATCWHLLGNAGVAAGWPAVFVGAGAALVALRPRARWTFVVLTIAVWASIWHEAPFLGNHWLLAGFVALAGCIGADPLPGVRLTVLGFYGFAAFAKLNADFFDPSVSCATFYLAESSRSLGWNVARLDGGAGMAVAVAVAATELAVPVLLAVRRTRIPGVAVGVVFHALLAVDHRHQFFDFTSLLVAVFLTFLPVAPSLPSSVGQRVRPQVLRGLLAVLALGAGGLVGSRRAGDLAFELGYASWQVVGAVVVVLVVRYATLAWRSSPPPGALRPGRMVIPVLVLVLVNGVAPYLELKTATSWNMYANLRTAAGDSNHYVVRATLPLTGAQDDPVEVLAADGPLGQYVGRDLLLAPRQLRWFLQHHPDTTATLRVDALGADARLVEVVPGRIPAELGPPVPEAIGRLVPLRAVARPEDPVACQEGFLPAG